MNIGVTIRGMRLQRGMSQGDIEKRTGLLRCYLSRVENGHTVPSLETLQKIAGALDLPLSQLFNDDAPRPAEIPGLSLNEDEIHFLTQVQRYSAKPDRRRPPPAAGHGAQIRRDFNDQLSKRSTRTRIDIHDWLEPSNAGWKEKRPLHRGLFSLCPCLHTTPRFPIVRANAAEIP